MLDITKVIRIERDFFPKFKNQVEVYIFPCEGLECNELCRIQKQQLKTRKNSLCKRCSQKGIPYMAKYNELKKSCKRRKQEFNITFEDFLQYTKIIKCHYCLSKINWYPFTKDTKNNSIVSRSYNLDRMNNNIGYLKNNCVVCCWKCNSAKSNRYTYVEWFKMTLCFRES